MNGPAEWHGSDKERLALITTITSVLSLVGSVAVLLIYCFYKSYRSQAAKITCFLAVADLVTSAGKVIGQAGQSHGDKSALCQVQAAVIFWGDLSSCFWVTIFGINVLLILCFNHGLADLRRYERYYLIIGYGLPLFFAVPPLFVRNPPMYAHASLWCWISLHYAAWRIFLFFIPLWILFAFNVAVYIISARILRKRTALSRMLECGSSALVNFRLKYTRNATVYIAAFIFTWAPSTINRASQTIFDQKFFELSIMQALSSPLRGLLHFIVFFYVTLYLSHRDGTSSRTSAEVSSRPDSQDAANDVMPSEPDAQAASPVACYGWFSTHGLPATCPIAFNFWGPNPKAPERSHATASGVGT